MRAIDVKAKKKRKMVANNPLKIDETSLGQLHPNDLIDNPALANTVLNHLRSCESKEAELRTENETLKTYPTNLELAKKDAKTVGLLNIITTVLIGFGINYLTNKKLEGFLFLILGVVIAGYSLYLSFKNK